MNTHRPISGVLTGTLTEGVPGQAEALEEAKRILNDAGFRLEVTVGSPWRGELDAPRPTVIPSDAPRPAYSSIEEIEAAFRLWASLRFKSPSSEPLRTEILKHLGYFHEATPKERQAIAVFYCGDPLSQAAAARQLGISPSAFRMRVTGAVSSMLDRLSELRRDYIATLGSEEVLSESVAVLDLVPNRYSYPYEGWDKLRRGGLMTVRDVAACNRFELFRLFDLRHPQDQEKLVKTLSESLARWGLELL